MSSIVCMEQKYEKVRKMQIFSEFFYEGGENPCGLPDGVPAKKEFPPPEGQPAEIGEKEAQGVI